MIPQEITPYFWDIDTDIFEPTQYPDYTIFRILQLGNEFAINWLKSIFSEDEIKRVIRTERRLSKKKAKYWAAFYNIDESEVSAFSYVPAFPFP
jgi:hypothetical protein